MKKILLAAVGMTGLLASCGGGSIVSGYYNGYGTSTSLNLTGVNSYTTDWQLSSSVKDQSGNTIAAGTYVICDNTTTNITVGINWTGGLSKLGVQLKGLNTGNTKNVNFYPYAAADFSGTGTATVAVGAGLAPLSITTQAITVNPINSIVNVKGYTYINVQGLDNNGLASNTVTSNYSIPVVDCK